MYLGTTNEKYLAIADINGRELFTLIPLGLIVIFVGIYPGPVLDLIAASLRDLNQIVIAHRPDMYPLSQVLSW